MTVCALALKLLWMRARAGLQLRAGPTRNRDESPGRACDVAVSDTRSAARRGCRRPARLVRPAKMIIRSRPNCCETFACPTRRPSPAATISTMEMTPQAMPNMVSAVRNLCAHSVWKTSRMRSRRTMRRKWPASWTQGRLRSNTRRGEVRFKKNVAALRGRSPWRLFPGKRIAHHFHSLRSNSFVATPCKSNSSSAEGLAARNVSSQPCRGAHWEETMRRWFSTRRSTFSPKPHCSMIGLGIRIPREFPIRTSSVLIATFPPVITLSSHAPKSCNDGDGVPLACGSLGFHQPIIVALEETRGLSCVQTR